MRWHLFGALVSACALSAQPVLANGITQLESGPGLVDWTVDPGSGRVFAADHAASKAREYDPKTGKVLRSFTTGEQPTRLVTKGNYLAVTNLSSMTLTVVDLTSNAVKGHVSLQAKGPYSVFATASNHPYVYVLARGNRDVVLQVDVARRRVVQQIQPTFSISPGRSQVAIGRDGRVLLSDGGQFHLLQLNEGPKTTLQVIKRSYASSSSGGASLSAGAHGRYWVRGNQLFDNQIDKPVRSFAGSPVALHPKLDLALSITRKDRWRPSASTLKVQRFSSAVAAKSFDLGLASTRRRRSTPSDRYRNQPFLRLDAKRNRLVYAWGEHAVVVDLRKLDLPQAPLVLLDVPAQKLVSLGDSLRIPLALTDASLTASFKLGATPDGLSLSGKTLTWTPRSDQVGLHTVQLTASAGGATDTATITVNVTRPQVTLPFRVTRVAVDPQGKYALATNVGTRSRMGRAINAVELALVDLTQRKVVAQRTLNKAINAVHVDGVNVYVGASTGNAFYSLKLSDLSDQKRAFVDKGPVSGFVTLPGGELAVQTQRWTHLYDAATLESAGAIEGDANVFAPLSDGMLAGGRVLDAAGELKMVVGHAGYGVPMLGGGMGRGGVPTLWNRRVDPSRLSDGQGQQVAQFNRGGSSWSSVAVALLRGAPAAGRLVVEAKQRSQLRTLKLEYRDLVEGGVRLTETLSVFKSASRSSFDGPRPILVEAGGRVVAAHDQSLFVLPLPTQALKSLPRPVEFKHAVATRTLTHKQRVSATLSGAGGAGSYTFSLAQPVEGVALDKSTGALTINGPKVWANYLKLVARYGGERWTRAGVLSKSQARYKALYGSATTAFPLFLPVGVTVTDAEGQKAQLVVTFGLTGPVVDVSELKPTAVAGRARRRNPRRVGPVGTGAAPVAAGAPAPSDLGPRLSRVERSLEELVTLEQSVTAIEKQLAEPPALASSGKDVAALEAELQTALERIELLEENTSAGLGLVGAVLGGLALIVAIAAIGLVRLKPAEALAPPPAPEPEPAPAPRARKRSRSRSSDGEGSGEGPVRKKRKKKKRVRPAEDLVGAGSGRLDVPE